MSSEHQLTDYYNKLWTDAGVPPYVNSFLEALDSIAIKDKPNKVLDIACGNGILGKYMMKEYQSEMYGLDLSQIALDACEKIGYKTALVNLETEPLPFEKEDFDIITLSAVVEHIISANDVLKSSFERLKPGGHIAVLTPNITWLVNRILFFFGKWEHRLMGGMCGHVNYMNKKQLTQSLTDAGFVDLNWDYSVMCVAGNTDFCQKGLSGFFIKGLSNRRVKFLHSLLSFNFIVTGRKPE